MQDFKANENRELIINADGVDYVRIPIKTHVITPDDTIEDVLDKYVAGVVEEGDIVFIAESIIAAIQKRVIKVSDIQPRLLAKILSKFVYRNPSDPDDPGLRLPETMELVMQEVGGFRILLAAIASVFGKLIGKRGLFYKIAGSFARDIDGPTPYTLPPYNEYIVLNPENPQAVADKAKDFIKEDVLIVDVNDLGANILGNSSESFSNESAANVLKDNPLGQGKEQTPIGIIRKA